MKNNTLVMVLINGLINCIDGNDCQKLIVNVFHNGWWKCEYVAWSHMCTLSNCNIVVALVAHLQQF
jgi:hypothetical protein